MIFRENITIESCDVDMRGVLRPTALMAYLEDVGSAEMAAFPPSNDDLRARNMGFITSRLVIRIHEELREGSEITLETWATDSRGLSFNRCYRVMYGNKVAVEVYSVWALLDFAEQKLMRLTDLEPIGGEPEPPLTLDIPLRVRIPAIAEMEKVADRPVYYSDCDLNGHFNNTKYLNMLCDFVPNIAKRTLRGINISYVNEAPFGDVLTVYAKEDGDTVYFRTVRSDGKTNCEAVLYL